MIRRRAKMQRRQGNVGELEGMDLTHMDADVRTWRTTLLGVEMQDHHTALLQDIQQSLALLVGRGQAAPSLSRPGAWPVVQPPPYVPPVIGVSPYVSPTSVQTVSVGMSLAGWFSTGPSVQVPVQTVFSQPPSQVVVCGQPAVSQPAQPQGTQPQQHIVQQPVPQGPQPRVGQVLGQSPWVPMTTIAAPKPFTRDKRGEDLDTWLRYLKHALTHHEVLKLPDPDKPFIVTTNASQDGIGAVLEQQEGQKLRPIAYMSKPSQKLAKSTYEKELYEIYKALTHWRHYLLGRFFIVMTDHHTLKWIRTQPVLSDALERWIKVIEQYDFEPQYLKGDYNKVVDALSRRPDFSGALITEFGLADDVTHSLVKAYREDPFMSKIIRRLEAKDKVTSVEFELVNGLLFL
ncbi:hypothetical protein CBR_g72664 [Chara braunii]|uniref:Reverse transcriptase RNase H-like domain-containing protein n=1 Tax=Chara braunii TaxID=69332 RepID=A0A388KA61_CHABU|nr:hypothetical protein CBR_g72664 [Chara braunii]|eukprot:GBG66909.1 hypothetical protein CBR_g72664 [Chara braunii]